MNPELQSPYEKLGVFYLGRKLDPHTGERLPDLLLYPSRQLVTHGLVVGMTGSGKTGLGCALVEEAAIDGIPALVIDPKGDLGNLLLSFPDLRAEDFAPWVDEADAAREGLAPAEFAARQAARWRNGLAEWNQDGDRIRRLRSAAEFAIYTPASDAGQPVSVLDSFRAPPPEVLGDSEWLSQRVHSLVSGLLALVGIEADPVRSRETILLANLVLAAWQQRDDLSLEKLVTRIQNPPLQRLGVLELEAFYPAKDRFELALRLNNLLASPGFDRWFTGTPLDLNRLLFTDQGKPRVAIFSLAHLNDAERMFVVTLLLNQAVDWMRAQKGTGSLRALISMDEIAGYFPPVSNPPSKAPLLTLLKQGRAFGVGVILATQNPVDLDYKGLANIGTWFIGRLQTGRDQARVMDGLEGAAAGRGLPFDRSEIERRLAGLGQRRFLLHSVHEDGSTFFEARWTLSYLRGPLSRDQIRTLTRQLPPAPSAGHAPASTRSPVLPSTESPTDAEAMDKQGSSERPVLPPGVPEFFLPAPSAGNRVRYRPRLLGVAQVRYVEPRLKVDTRQTLTLLAQIEDGPIPVDWTNAKEFDGSVNDLAREPGGVPTLFDPCPAPAARARNYEAWSKELSQWIRNERRLTLWHSPALGQTSHPEESEKDFRVRLQQYAREQRDSAAEQLRQRYAPKLAGLEERLRQAESAREREAQQASRAKLDTFISIGSTLLGAFLGRRRISSTSVGRAASSLRSMGRAAEQSSDVGRAEERIEGLQASLEELHREFDNELAGLSQRMDPAVTPLEMKEVPARPSDVQIQLVALVWQPE